MAKRKEKPIKDGKEMSLSEWLEALKIPETRRKFHLLPDNCFPTDEHRSEYLDSIKNRENSEIRHLLRNFLIKSGCYGTDRLALASLKGEKLARAFDRHEYVRRMLRSEPNWEGLSWVLDLLHRPRMAIQVLEGYLAAHFWWMTDNMIDGLYDAMAIIRAAYIEVNHPQEVLLDLGWRDFELYVASLFSRKGFEVKLTPPLKDGGCDILIKNSETTRAEYSLVECKRYKDNVGVKEVRALLGVVEQKNASRGIIVTTSKFTTTAIMEAQQTSRLELIDFTALQSQLNQYFSPNWPKTIDSDLAMARRDFEFNQKSDNELKNDDDET
jgi:restriction system protein